MSVPERGDAGRIHLYGPPISETAGSIPPSPVRALEELAANLPSDVELVRWGIGAPTHFPPESILQAQLVLSQQAFTDRRLTTYGESRGAIELRRDIAERLSRRDGLKQLTENNIIVTQGSSEAILFTILATTDPGDAIVMPEPYYFNNEIMANLVGRKVIPIHTQMKDGFHVPPIQSMIKSVEEALLSDRTIKKAPVLWVASPGNPSGTVYGHTDWDDLIEMARLLNMKIVSDEAYWKYVYDGKKYISVFQMIDEGSEGVVILGSHSKNESVPGMRVGYVATYDKDTLTAIGNEAQMRGSGNPLTQLALARASEIEEQDEQYYLRHVENYQRRRDFIYQRLKGIPGVNVAPYSPEGAFYMIAELPVDSANDFCKWLLTDFVSKYGEKETLIMVPLITDKAGFYYDKSRGTAENRQVRIAFVVNEEQLEKGAKILERALERYRVRNEQSEI